MPLEVPPRRVSPSPTEARTARRIRLDLATYDHTAGVLRLALDRAKVDRSEKAAARKRLRQLAPCETSVSGVLL